MPDASRIDQFRKLAEADPSDELAHFSLGTALLEAGQPKEAGPSFQRVLALNSQNSKAYQMLGQAQKEAGNKDLAIQTLTNGYRIAHKKGDLMPLKAMASLLQELGAQVPDMAEKKAAAAAGATPGDGSFTCSRCGSGGPRQSERPFKGPLGERILATVCANCWKEWVGMGTKVINELRLPMFDPAAQEMYDKHMKEFLGLD